MSGENPEPEPEILKLTEVAAYLRVAKGTVYRLLKAQQLPGFQVGNDWRFRVEDIERWCMRARERSAHGSRRPRS